MRLLFVRHGESVDNVAGLYAGSRDSALTAHGVLQARRLGAHLAAMAPSAVSGGSHAAAAAAAVVITNIFSSDLQRAFATASAILDAQNKKGGTTDGLDLTDGVGVDGEKRAAAAAAREVTTSADLRERDFRSAEGLRFGGGGGGGGGDRSAFADAESRVEMRVRAERFIDEHLRSLLLPDGAADDRRTIVVVAHGIILNVLLSSLLRRYAPSELARLLPPPVGGAQPRPSELRLPWANTGYLAMSVKTAAAMAPSKDGAGSGAAAGGGVRLRVTALNCVEHLGGLKKTRGGIGSAKFDAQQKTMDAFLRPAAKRQKREGGDA